MTLLYSDDDVEAVAGILGGIHSSKSSEAASKTVES